MLVILIEGLECREVGRCVVVKMKLEVTRYLQEEASVL